VSDRFFSALAGSVVRFRWLVVAVWIALIVVTSVAFPSLSSEVNNDNSQFLPATAPSSLASNLAAPILGNSNTESQLIVVAEDSHSQLTLADESALGRELADVRVQRFSPKRIYAGVDFVDFLLRRRKRRSD